MAWCLIKQWICLHGVVLGFFVLPIPAMFEICYTAVLPCRFMSS